MLEFAFKYEYANDADFEIYLRGAYFIHSNKENWSGDTNDIAYFYEEFEHKLDATLVVDFTDDICYFKENKPVAWANFKKGVGFKPKTV